MANPTNTARTLPTGYKLPDGYSTTYAFALKPAVQLYEKTVKPPGFDGKEAVDTTTMLNVAWRTMHPRFLVTLTESTFKAGYDPDMYSDLISMLNRPQSITIHFPSLDQLSFWGFIQSLEFDDLEEGKFPEVTVKVTPTNVDPGDNSESGPLYTAATGT